MAEQKKLPSTFKNMVIVLTTISLLSALALGFTYNLTKQARGQVAVQKILKSLKEVLPPFDNNPDREKRLVKDAANLESEIFPARMGEETVGTAVKTYSTKGYGGQIWLMVGFDRDNKIVNIAVVEQKETPGLGAKVGEPAFKDQFNGKDPGVFDMRVKKDGGKVDAISAATITSRAFADAVKRAYELVTKGDRK